MTHDEIAFKVKAIIIDNLGVKEHEVVPEATFTGELGADSLDSVELIMELEKQFEIKIDDTDAEKVLTVGAAISCVENALKNK